MAEPIVTDPAEMAERQGLTSADVAELTWDDRSQIEEDARYEARRDD